MSQRGAGGSPWGEGALASFLGRANYNYKETYMASLTMRADGSSNFPRGNRWGTFLPASAGWVMSNESLWKIPKSWMDFLKLRASWGQNGNSAIDNFHIRLLLRLMKVMVTILILKRKHQTVGGYADILANPDVKWETFEQLNLGFDSRFP